MPALADEATKIVEITCSLKSSEYSLVPFYAHERGGDWSDIAKKHRIVKGETTYLLGEGKVTNTCRLQSSIVQTEITYNPPSARGTCGGTPYGIARIRSGDKLVFAEVIHSCTGGSPSEVRYRVKTGWEVCFGVDNQRRCSSLPDA